MSAPRSSQSLAGAPASPLTVRLPVNRTAFEGAGQCAWGWRLNYAGGFAETVTELADYEKAGLDIVFVPEAYSFDAVSQLGFIAARTERLQLASGILQLYSRTPALTAMTAAGLDYVSGGRFTLGIGASGPQVIEGWHGVPYDAPVGRSRELIEICRMVWRRDRLVYDGKHYQHPAARGAGDRPGQAAQAHQPPGPGADPDHARRGRAPKNVALAAELAEGWQPFFYLPERAGEIWGAAGGRRAWPSATRRSARSTWWRWPRWLIGDDVTSYRDLARPFFALYIGGMGARGQNFYHALATRLGYGDAADQIQDAYLDGRKAEAEALVPDELLEKTSLIGPEGYVAGSGWRPSARPA